MIDDLKADSARWESERRAQSSRAAASLSIHALADASRIVARHSSNSPLAQYRMSDIHMARQHHGPSEVYGDNSGAREPPSGALRYPGTGAPGYTGASGTYPNQQGYAPPSGNGYPYPPNQSPQPAASRNPPQSTHPGSVMSPPGYPTGQDHPYVATGANNNRYDAYSRGNVQPGPQMSDYGSQAQAQPGYPAAYSQYSNQVSPGAHGGMQPPEGYYDRGMFSIFWWLPRSIGSLTVQSCQQSRRQWRSQWRSRSPRWRAKRPLNNSMKKPLLPVLQLPQHQRLRRLPRARVTVVMTGTWTGTIAPLADNYHTDPGLLWRSKPSARIARRLGHVL